MTQNENKLLSIIQKENPLPMPNAQLHTLEVPESMYYLALHLMSNENLCKHFRNMITLEEYETAEVAKNELIKRGYKITFKDKLINFSPK